MPWYTTEAFHKASLCNLLQRVGQPPPASSPVTFGFQDPPRVLVVANPVNGAGQVAAIERQLAGLCPSLAGRFSRAVTDQGAPPPEVGSMLLVYLTEGLFTDDLALLAWLQRCINRDVNVVWVAETDMRHGWMDESAVHAEHGWRDALRSSLVAQHVSGDVALAVHASVVPFYKDSLFRTVALQLMLQGLGAARYDHTPLHTTTHHTPIEFDDLTQLKKISCGAFGEVYCGTWRSGGTKVALKTIHSTAAAGSSSSGRYASSRSSSDSEFASEIEFSISAHHPNIVQTLGTTRGGFASQQPQDALVMEYLPQTLCQFLQEHRPLAVVTRASIAAGIVSGMTFLHLHKSVAHLDLKSNNILMDGSRPKIADFGLSRAAAEKLGDDLQRSASTDRRRGKGSPREIALERSDLPGTGGWMAPEILSRTTSNSAVTTQADVYSFGIVLWEMISNMDLYDAWGQAALGGGRSAIAAVIPAWAARGLRPAIPECEAHWRTAIENCWHTNPGERPTFHQVASRFFPDYQEMRLGIWREVVVDDGTSNRLSAVQRWLHEIELGRCAASAATLGWSELRDFELMVSTSSSRPDGRASSPRSRSAAAAREAFTRAMSLSSEEEQALVDGLASRFGRREGSDGNDTNDASMPRLELEPEPEPLLEPDTNERESQLHTLLLAWSDSSCVCLQVPPFGTALSA